MEVDPDHRHWLHLIVWYNSSNKVSSQWRYLLHDGTHILHRSWNTEHPSHQIRSWCYFSELFITYLHTFVHIVSYSYVLKGSPNIFSFEMISSLIRCAVFQHYYSCCFINLYISLWTVGGMLTSMYSSTMGWLMSLLVSYNPLAIFSPYITIYILYLQLYYQWNELDK